MRRHRPIREPIHPGETLREDLDALGMSAAELARRIEVPVNRISQILNGRRAVTGDTALRLGRFFGTSGEFWLNLQKLYELRLSTAGARNRRHGAAPGCPLPRHARPCWDTHVRRFLDVIGDVEERLVLPVVGP